MIFGPIAELKENLMRPFVNQFDEYQGHLVYRHHSKAAPIRVTEAERDSFIAEFERFANRLIWWSFPMLLLTILGLVILDEQAVLPMPHWVQVAVGLLLLPVFVILCLRALGAPKRKLAGRAPMGGERSTGEMRQVLIKQMPWPHLILPLIMGCGAAWLAFNITPQARIDHWWLLPILLLFAACMILAGVWMICLKWKNERR